MGRVTLNAGCRRSDGGAIGRQSCERLAIYYSGCLFVSAAARAVFILRSSTSVLGVLSQGRPHRRPVHRHCSLLLICLESFMGLYNERGYDNIYRTRRSHLALKSSAETDLGDAYDGRHRQLSTVTNLIYSHYLFWLLLITTR